jgi:D-arabinose 1-dehydrogenase-like Zn-dependent alcohol dehydrogenase
MADTMLAARFTGVGQPLRIEEVPRPEPGPLEVLVRVDACGICLSDVHLLDGGIPAVRPEVIPGHEASGTVVAPGALVSGWTEGERATLAGGKPCGRCARCRVGRMDECLEFEIMGFHYDGAWAEYIAVPFFTLSPVPAGVVPEQAAILADAVATPYAALSERAALRPGESVGLWGIGGLGTHAVQIARLLGAGLIVAVDPLASARDRALKLGADAAIDPSAGDAVAEIRSLTGGVGLDVAVDLVGSNRVMKQAVAALARRGRAVMVGLSIDPLELGPGILLGVQSQSILGHLGYEKRHLDDLVALLAGGRLDLTASISDVIPLADVADGVKRLAEKDGDPVRIVVRP